MNMNAVLNQKAILLLLLFAPFFAFTATAQTTDGHCIQGTKDSDLRLRRIFYPKDDSKLQSLHSIVGLIQDPRPEFKDSWYAVLQNGKVVLLDRMNSLKRELFADFSKKTIYQGEMGLLGFAFQPDFRSNSPAKGSYFINYIAQGPLRTVIARVDATFSSKPSDALPLGFKQKEILEIDQPAENHNGGTLLFGPDRNLYVSLGDGGASHDRFKNGQNLRTLLGKILRLNVVGQDTYKIPNDNPFVSDKTGKTKTEIYSWGLRNPWKMSFDIETGTLIAGDVGQDRYEEINIIQKGKNYGWPVLEGFHCLSDTNCNKAQFEDPVLEYGRKDGQSVTGGFIYRGKNLENLKGLYIFGDYSTGNIWAANIKQKNDFRLIASTPLSISSFAQDSSGELFALSLDGRVYSIEKNQKNSANCPRDP